MAYLCVSRATMAHVHAGGTTMALRHGLASRLGSATMALCSEDRATAAHVFVDGTTVVPCQ